MALIASAGVMADAGTPPQAALSRLSGLQLLLRFLPFRATPSHATTQQHAEQIMANRHKLLTELQRNPLWQFSTTLSGDGPLRPGSLAAWQQPLTPQEAESALLAYVRLAAEAEQQQDDTSSRRHGRQQLSAADVAADLHALYTLAAAHAATQQKQEQEHPAAGPGSKQWRHQHGRHSLTGDDFLQLLKAYAYLGAEDNSSSSSSSNSDAGAQHQGEQVDGQGSTTWGDSQTPAAAAAAAMQALYAFAQLADAAQEQPGQQQGEGLSQPTQQQQAGQAPGQLQACLDSGSSASTAVQVKHTVNDSSSPSGHIGSGSNGNSGSNGMERSRNIDASGDLEVLLQLARMTLQAAS